MMITAMTPLKDSTDTLHPPYSKSSLEVPLPKSEDVGEHLRKYSK